MAVDDDGFQVPDGRPVVTPGTNKKNRDFDINGHDLGTNGSGDYETGVLDVSGTTSVTFAISSDDSDAFTAEIDLYNDAGDTVLTTVTNTQDPSLASTNNGDLFTSTWVYSDQIKIRLADNADPATNTINGSINVNAGIPSGVQIQDRTGDSRASIVDLDDSSVSTSYPGLITRMARSLDSIGLDTVVSADETKTGVSYGQQDVSTAGTAEALNGGTSLSVPNGAVVTVRAHVASSGDLVYVGDTNVSSSDGFKLADGEGVSLAVDDVSTIFVDADTAGDGVSWIVEQDS